MLQYLINTTTIWLLSLVIFDLFLRKESYHMYNRTYLLSTLVAGFLVPVIQWPSGASELSVSAFRDAREIMTVGERLTASPVAAAGNAFNVWNVLLIVYIVGICVVLFFLAKEMIRLVTLYKNGRKHKQGQLTIVETGKNHGPFSLLNIIFVESQKQYTNDEWQMLLSHENAHYRLLHFADLLLLQLCSVALWFHPLVYIYKKRLLMVHEFQADTVSADNTTIYSRFLVEQSVLLGSTSLSHSFNYSPIKSRILMLTHRSAGASRLKMLVVMPLAVLSITLFSKTGFSQKFEKKGNKVTYKGNTFELSDAHKDTIILVNPVTGKEEVKVAEMQPKPIKMNGKAIAIRTDKAPYFTAPDKNLKAYLVKKLEKELSQLQDGEYILQLANVITDEQGRIVYFEYEGIDHPQLRTTDGANQLVKQAPINKQLQEEISKKAYELIDAAPAYIPASLNGQPVPAYGESGSYEWFTIKDHQVKFK